jgi:hypothetical protein
MHPDFSQGEESQTRPGNELERKEKVMNVGESVVLVRGVNGVEEGTRGRVKDTKDDRVVVECKTRERSTIVLTNMWDVLPERLWDRLIRRRMKVG